LRHKIAAGGRDKISDSLIVSSGSPSSRESLIPAIFTSTLSPRCEKTILVVHTKGKKK
jgi:hypothetical protein